MSQRKETGPNAEHRPSHLFSLFLQCFTIMIRKDITQLYQEKPRYNFVQSTPLQKKSLRTKKPKCVYSDCMRYVENHFKSTIQTW